MIVRIEFYFNKLGRGNLVLIDNSTVIISYKARTGSINSDGHLIKSIPERTWYILKPSINTDETGMTITKGLGWKIRLYTALEGGYSHYLIHPDGNKPGSNGCIVIPFFDALDFKNLVDSYLVKQGIIDVHTKLKGGSV